MHIHCTCTSDVSLLFNIMFPLCCFVMQKKELLGLKKKRVDKQNFHFEISYNFTHMHINHLMYLSNDKLLE